MKLSLSLPTLILILPLCIDAMAHEVGPLSFTAAVQDQTRLQEHRDRDKGRKPAEILHFAFPEGIAGKIIADLVPAGGYYTAILSRAVGGQGKVIAIDPIRIFEYVPSAKTAYSDYASKEPLTNVVYSAQKLDELKIDVELDGATMVLYYHDTFWTGVDRAAMNKKIFAALKPGAHFLIVDHHAPSGSDLKVTQTIHRMDPALVKPELLRAGFEFVGSSDVLENNIDTQTEHVFKEGLRGNTSRFAYLFRKPVAGE